MTYIGNLTSGTSSSSTGTSSSTGVTGGISGLASGIDTDSIVQGLMEAADEPLIQLLQQRQITEWKQESYQRVNNTLADLQSNLSSLRLQSTFLQTSTTSSNSSMVSATSNSLSPTGTYSVSTYQLASGATISSSSTLSTDSNYGNETLAQIDPSLASSTNATFTLNGQTFTFNPQTDTINTVLQAINANPSAGVTGFYDTNAGKVVLQTTSTGTGAMISVSNDTSGIFSTVFGLTQTNPSGQPMTINANYTTVSGVDMPAQAGTVDINGTKFSFNTSESYEQIASIITAQSAQTGVSATYDATNHQLDLVGATTAGQTLNFSSMPAAGDTLNIDGVTFAFADGSGSSSSADYTIDLTQNTTPSAIASAIATDVNNDSTLSTKLSATVVNSNQLVLTALTTGTQGNFTTSYTPSSPSITVGTETLGTADSSGSSGTPSTQTVTFTSVPAAGDKLTVAGQTIEFYNSANGPAPTGTGITAIDVNGQTASGIASAVANVLSGSATGEASSNVLTITATKDGPQSLDTTYVSANAPSGIGATNVQDSELFSGIVVTDPTANVSSGMDAATNTALGTIASTGLPASVQTAKDAYYSVNGYATSSQSNQAVYNDITFNLTGVTGSNAPVTVTVAPNTNAIVTAITNFVQQYNETLQYMQGQYNTQRNYDYQPLTAAQAAQMTDTQVTEWNQKAQAGMLENDPLLGNVMNTLKNITVSTVSNQPTVDINGQPTQLNSLASIGISPIDIIDGVSSGATAPGVTTSGYNTYGLLQINTAQLQAAVEADPTAVMNLFTASGTGTSSSTSTSSSTGIAKQLYSAVSSSITQIQQQAGTGDTYDPTSPANLAASSSSSSSSSSLLDYTLIDPTADLSQLFSLDSMNTSFLGTQISTLDSQALTMNTQLQALQQRYQTEYANMETAIENVDSQSSYIVSMMGGSTSS